MHTRLILFGKGTTKHRETRGRLILHYQVNNGDEMMAMCAYPSVRGRSEVKTNQRSDWLTKTRA